MNLHELVVEARTCRRFSQKELSSSVLTELVNTARIVSSARNAQILRYVIVQDKNLRKKMEEAYVLGGALAPEEKPKKGVDDPTAYIVLLAPENTNQFGIMDIGIAAQTIQLAATEKGYATCIIGAFKKNVVIDLLKEEHLDLEGDTLVPYLVIAVGYAGEKRELGKVGEDGITSYYHDENGTNIVPKHELKDVLLLQK